MFEGVVSVLWTLASWVVVVAACLYVYNSVWGASKHAGVCARKRREKDYPMQIPRGWYKLMESSELKPGDSKSIEALGTTFVVFRGNDNKQVAIMDAYCVHMGANLGMGGKVVGDCIQCPFHLWEYDTDGKCQKIPYQANVPEKLAQPTYPSMEYYGLILVWYDIKKNAPTFTPPVIAALDGNDYVLSGSYKSNIGMHLIEIAENSADFHHFATLHGTMCVPYTQIPIPFIKIVHVANAEYGVSSAPHLLQFQDKAHIRMFGRDVPRTNAVADITYIGPSCIMCFQFTTDAGKIILFQTHTPNPDPLNCNTEFLWYAEKKVWRALAWYVVGNWISQWKNDVFIWEHKTYMRKPYFVKGDGPIMKLRRWMFQFYDHTDNAVNTVEYEDDGVNTANSAEYSTVSDNVSNAKKRPNAANAAAAVSCVGAKGADW